MHPILILLALGGGLWAAKESQGSTRRTFKVRGGRTYLITLRVTPGMPAGVADNLKAALGVVHGLVQIESSTDDETVFVYKQLAVMDGELDSHVPVGVSGYHGEIVDIAEELS